MAASYLDESRLTRSIAAIATAPGAGAIGIVRISGADAVEIGARVFSRPELLRRADSHTLHIGRIVSPSGSTIDDVLVLIMRAPRSYTGETTVEFHTHGGQIQAERVLRTCLDAGALPALPGEFTFRAFASGRIDLTQAEGVADLIAAGSELAARVALAQSEGALSRELAAVREELIGLRSRCEVNIDFVDDDISESERPVMRGSMCDLGGRLQRLADSYATGRVLRSGARVTISGAPNVGKSSLFNAILRADRAIVTDLPGTTRDAVTESIAINGLHVILADTAGIRPSDDLVELEGIRRSRSYRTAADLILEVSDSSQICAAPPPGEAIGTVQSVINKVDLLDGAARAGLERNHPDALLVSARTGEGVDSLCDRIFSRLVREHTPGLELTITRQRHYEGLRACQNALARAELQMEQDEPLELVALELRAAGAAIDELVGKICDDEVLNRIFGDFCIGK